MGASVVEGVEPVCTAYEANFLASQVKLNSSVCRNLCFCFREGIKDFMPSGFFPEEMHVIPINLNSEDRARPDLRQLVLLCKLLETVNKKGYPLETASLSKFLLSRSCFQQLNKKGF